MLKPEYFVFDDLIQKRLFRIPNFQRAYSWEKKQRSDLLDDIIKVYYKEKETKQEFAHFMSTVVCLEHEIPKITIGASEFECLDIVDGQQRLTTLIILLKSISNALRKGNKQHKEYAKAIDLLLIKQM